MVGVDLSADQLRVARRRADAPDVALVAADAAALPFADGSFDAVVSVLTHTDFDHPEAAFAEAARVLRRGGRFSYVGIHPCFVSPFVERHPTGTHRLHPGYRLRGWHHSGPGFGEGSAPASASTICPWPTWSAWSWGPGSPSCGWRSRVKTTTRFSSLCSCNAEPADVGSGLSRS